MSTVLGRHAAAAQPRLRAGERARASSCSTSPRSRSIRSRARTSSTPCAALRARGTTILYTTHYLEEAEDLCDRIAIMDEGQVVACGTLPELLGRSQRDRGDRAPPARSRPRRSRRSKRSTACARSRRSATSCASSRRARSRSLPRLYRAIAGARPQHRPHPRHAGDARRRLPRADREGAPRLMRGARRHRARGVALCALAAAGRAPAAERQSPWRSRAACSSAATPSSRGSGDRKQKLAALSELLRGFLDTDALARLAAGKNLDGRSAAEMRRVPAPLPRVLRPHLRAAAAPLRRARLHLRRGDGERRPGARRDRRSSRRATVRGRLPAAPRRPRAGARPTSRSKA